MIVVFGSIGVDLVTRVRAFPQPGETVACDGYELVPGTKGANQALAARRAGARVMHVATRGDDAFGAVATSLLHEAGVDLSLVGVSALPTGTCMIAVNAAGENTIVAASGANAGTSVAALRRCALAAGDTLLLQREIPDEETFEAVRFGHARGARVVLNVAPAAPVPAAILALVDILVLNETEALVVGRAMGIGGEDPQQVGGALARLHGRSVVVTLGAAGAVMWSGESVWRAPALAVSAVDTTAAGDSFVGYLAASLDAGGEPEQALRRGAAAGSLCCARHGAQPAIPDRASVDAALGLGSAVR